MNLIEIIADLVLQIKTEPKVSLHTKIEISNKQHCILFVNVKL